ncbi:MAG: PAQR family membrane homeostasis protein TrhA [bacterium]
MKKTEKVSFYTHLLGAIGGIIGTIYLIYITLGQTSNLIVSIIYGVSTIILFSSSTLYHYFKQKDEEESIWRKLDHFSIFIMIAGTYTPIAYIYLSGYWTWVIIILQWSLVTGGFFFKFYYLNIPRYLYTLIYLIMGWTGIVPIKIFINTMPFKALLYLFSGGILYTIGATFYILKKPVINERLGFHEIFHIFILLGGFSHYMLVLTAVI